ncbi:hypothetical protein OG432_30355 [Streptomyces sp. NBC_00442]|uniref:hypothetical protein n=1 Tax=Streptomyces sp. NBC_00442 TaxID=2903651 RepID=UPI002E1E7F74
MSRRRVRAPAGDEYPPPLDVFSLDDWWVRDPEDAAETQYALIQWTVARRAYREGWRDWESFLPSPRPGPKAPDP